MSKVPDLIVRGGLVHDGSGAAPFRADIAVTDGLISAIGTIAERATEEIDATGRIVTPGFVDIHTHYDGQATWTDRLRPSSSHGVTTVVMGNCGVGFAPCRPADRDTLIRLMEGVEDIPGVVMAEGLPWSWETFPEFLDFLSHRHYDMDIAIYVPHAPIRLYAMGDRAVTREPANQLEMSEMARLVEEGLHAGALGFATSRSIFHKASDGTQIPSYAASESELATIAQAMKRADRGVIQMISDFDDPDPEFEMIRRVVAASGRALTFTLVQMSNRPDVWRQILDKAQAANDAGIKMTPQVAGRPTGLLVGLELSVNPFSFCPAYRRIAALPFAQRLEAMRSPAIRRQITGEYPTESWEPVAWTLIDPSKIFVLGATPDYEPAMDDSLGAIAARLGIAAAEYMYDLLIEGDGRTVFYIPVSNFAGGSIAAVEALMRSEITVPALGDGGAHYGSICDASLPTYNLLRWSLEKTGPLSLPMIVKALSADTANTVGLGDRGRLEIGLRGDINVIDWDRLSIGRPGIVYDLPTGGGRLDQHAEGYVATIVAGEVTYRDGRATGALPGRLVRGARKVAALH